VKPATLRFVVVGLAICIAFAAIAPFVASSNPDGLDSTAQGLLGEEGASAQEQSYYQGAPLPDYVVPQLGEDTPSSAVAVVIGVVAVLVVAWAMSSLVIRGREK